MADMSSLVAGLGALTSLVGMGTSTTTELGYAYHTFNPPAQVQAAPVQQCPLDAYGQTMRMRIETLPDGRQQVICEERSHARNTD